MPLYETILPSETPISITIFGVQHQALSEEAINTSSHLLETLQSLLDSEPTHHTETLSQDSPVPTTILLTYWASHTSFQDWFTSPSVSSFWSSLPANAGIYRETFAITPGLTQHGTNDPSRPSGLANLGRFEELEGKQGYWGCYYDRMRDVTRETRETVRAPLAQGQCPFRHGTAEATAEAAAAESPSPTSPIRREENGRIKLTNLPDNICFAVEGQDHTRLTPSEKTHWFAHFDGPVTAWVTDLIAATNNPAKTGVLDSKICYDSTSDLYRAPAAEPSALNYNRKTQLFWFIDMEAMEKLGRENKGHVQLRRKFMQDYGPGGVLVDPQGEVMGEGGPGLCLWVEVSILKGRDVECEYVGCVEGTGLLGVEWA